MHKEKDEGENWNGNGDGNREEAEEERGPKNARSCNRGGSKDARGVGDANK